ncbi:hypothetical protein QTI66_14365 [Variovorax sp. J22R133]|uniref:sensor histidine kinase n=1 Tax=Variovorax brevis TaxID=3053503 RepID=UPI0025789198|nr:hypothetical protein [Variovorax sp. J22R133]MDM0113338.1 hypothetical protein [Variovorax sp. J22R133]
MILPVASNIGVAVMAVLSMAMLWRSLNARLALGASQPNGGSASPVPPADLDLDFSRDEQQPTDLRQLLDETPQHCHALLRSSEITWTQSVPKGALNVYARRQELQQLLAHVVAMACQAMPRGGVLNVVAVPQDTQAVIQFRDTGFDRQEPLLSGLFLHGSRALAGSGDADSILVAGVASCRRIVQEHGGCIEMAPLASSGELALTIRLPLREDAANWSRY